jgi:hypothetical protein
MNIVYAIKKTMVDNKGKKTHVLLTDGSSQIMELKHENIAKKMVEVFNENSDSGWVYEIVEIKSL